MYKLLITGSRKAQPIMQAVALKAVSRAKVHRWSIIVGDASGIDLCVQFNCCWLHVPFAVYGITPAPRNICCDVHRALYTQVDGDYLARDRHMVELADRVFAIWNGESRGTKYTYDYAVRLGKQADIRTVR